MNPHIRDRAVAQAVRLAVQAYQSNPTAAGDAADVVDDIATMARELDHSAAKPLMDWIEAALHPVDTRGSERLIAVWLELQMVVALADPETAREAKAKALDAIKRVADESRIGFDNPVGTGG